jgi:hypothetical protein
MPKDYYKLHFDGTLYWSHIIERDGFIDTEYKMDPNLEKKLIFSQIPKYVKPRW